MKILNLFQYFRIIILIFFLSLTGYIFRDSNGTNTPRFITNLTYFEKSGFTSKRRPLIYDIELKPGMSFHNQFILKHSGQTISCATEILSNYLDRSIKKLRLIWIAQSIQAFEVRNYELYQGKSKQESSLLIVLQPDSLIEVNNNCLQIQISSTGIREIRCKQKIYQINDFVSIENQRNENFDSRDVNRRSLPGILTLNKIYCQISINNVEDNNFKYSRKYTIFNNIPIIIIKTNIYSKNTISLNLFESQVYEFDCIDFPEIRFFGWKEIKNKVLASEDYYDYLIADKPKSRLYLKYLNDRLQKIKYHYISLEKDFVPQNFFMNTIIDSIIAISFLTDGTAWKANSAFHVALQNKTLHLSWHGHGFQKGVHQQRFYRSQKRYLWKAHQLETFQSLIFLHKPQIPSSALVDSLKAFDIFQYF